MLPRSTTRPLYFWYFGSNSAFLIWQMSISVPKWTYLFFLCASRTTSFLLITLDNCRAGIFSSFFPCLCPLLPSRPEFSSLEASEQTCTPSCSDLSNWALSPRYDLHDPLVESIPNPFSWVHEPPRFMHALSCGFCWSLSFSLAVSCSLFERCFAPMLQGIVRSIGISNFPSFF